MLQSPQVYALRPDGTDAADFTIAGPATMTGIWTTGLAGMQSVSVELRFLWGSGGANCKVLLQTALGDDTPAFDIAQVTFAAAARTVVFELYGGTTVIIDPAAGGVDSTGNDVLADGLSCRVLGDRLRLMAVVTGTYVNTTLSGRILPK